MERGELERRERIDLGMEDHWDDPANPDLLDESHDPETFATAAPVRLWKVTDPKCGRLVRLGWSRRSWGACPGRVLDGSCTWCRRPPRSYAAVSR